MRLTLILALLLTGCASNEFNRAPWDGYGCTFKPDGKPVSYPCIDNRMAAPTPEQLEQWGRINLEGLIAHSRVESVFDLCEGEYACKIGDSYHVTSGDVAALVWLAAAGTAHQISARAGMPKVLLGEGWYGGAETRFSTVFRHL
jgi:hypothetical protein